MGRDRSTLESIVDWVDAAQHPDAGPIERARGRAQHLMTLMGLTLGSGYILAFGYFGIAWAPWVLLPLSLRSLPTAVGNSRNKDPALFESEGDTVLLAAS